MIVRADVYETAAAIVVEADLPGVPERALEVFIGSGFLTLRGAVDAAAPDGTRLYRLRERRHGSFSRDIPLPEAVVAEAAAAEHRDGVLRVTIPKDPSAKPKLQQICLA